MSPFPSILFLTSGRMVASTELNSLKIPQVGNCHSSFFFFLIPDFPEEAKWLQPEERAYVAARLKADQGRSARERPITLKDIGRVFSDYKVIVAGFMYFGLIVPAYG